MLEASFSHGSICQMYSDEFIKRMQADCRAFLAHQLTARGFVRQIDDLVGDEYPDDLHDEISQAVIALHEWAAFYVEDPTLRGEFPDYIGERELKEHVGEFLEKLDEISG